MKRNNKGSIIEYVAGTMLLVFIGLFLVDVGALVFVADTNHMLCQHAAVAAAQIPNTGTSPASQAQTTAQSIISNTPVTPLLENVQMTSFVYGAAIPNSTVTQVLLSTTAVCQLPFEVPLIHIMYVNLSSSASWPIASAISTSGTSGGGTSGGGSSSGSSSGSSGCGN
jgi:uncharacterized membrane protein YgcG